MINFVKFFLVPIAIGFVLHVGTDLLNFYLFSAYGPSVHHRPVPVIFFYSTAWLNLLHAVLPGLAVGFFAKGKPALLGFIAILLAQVFIGIGNTRYGQPYPLPLIHFFSIALPISFYGLVTSIAGFAIKQTVLTTQSRGTSV